MEEISLEPVQCQVPGYNRIELIRSYRKFASYYPTCELETKAWFVRNTQPDWVIFDCGANVGYYSILFSQLTPEGSVYAFEPTSTYDLLTANLEHNQCENVNAQNVGLGKESGTRKDKVYRVWGEEPDIAEFPFTSIDDFVTHHKIDRIDCLKIDVDSYDFEVLQGAEKTIMRFNPWIVIEVNYALRKRGVDEATVYKWFAERGFTDVLVLDGENLIAKRWTYPAMTHRKTALPFVMWLG